MRKRDDFAMAFVHKRGYVNGELRGSAVIWTHLDPIEWYRAHYKEWIRAYVLGSDVSAQFRMTSAPTTDWVESDPSGLTKDDRFVSESPIEFQMQLACIQKQHLVDLDPTAQELPLPFFLSTRKLGIPKCHRLPCELRILSVDDLPDVRALVREELGDVTTDAEKRAVMHLSTRINMPIPKDIWLPATHSTTTADNPVVYRIVQSDERHAVVDVFLPDSTIEIKRGNKLKRRICSAADEIDEAVIAEFV